MLQGQPSGLIKPGDTLGEMGVVKTAIDALRYSDHCKFPEGTPHPHPPGTYEIDCQVPSSNLLWLSDGWGAIDKQTLEDNWRTFTFEMYIDDLQVDLEAFGTIDHERDGYLREFNVALENPSRKHIVRVVHVVKQDIFDGKETSSAGTYVKTTNVTITSP